MCVRGGGGRETETESKGGRDRQIDRKADKLSEREVGGEREGVGERERERERERDWIRRNKSRQELTTSRPYKRQTSYELFLYLEAQKKGENNCRKMYAISEDVQTGQCHPQCPA